MLIYFFIYIPFVLCAFFDFFKTSQKNKNTILWFWVIVFTLFRGLRWEIGTDWNQFFDVYSHSGWDNIFSYYRDNWSNKVMDYGYMFINALFNETGFPYTVFLLVTNFWIMWCFMDFSKRHSKYPILTLIMLMNIGVPFPVRQTIAFATSLWGYRFVVEKKWLKFIIVAIIASLIHKGSLICLIVIFIRAILSRYNIKWWGYAIVYLSTFLIASIFRYYITIAMTFLADVGGQISEYSSSYMNMDSTSVDYGNFNNSLLNGLSYSVFFAILLYVREKYNTVCVEKIKAFEFFFLLYAISAIIENLIRLGVSSGSTEVLGRVFMTINMFPLMMPLIFTIFISLHVKNRYICYCGFCGYMLYKFWLQIPGDFYHDLYIPYNSVL